MLPQHDVGRRIHPHSELVQRLLRRHLVTVGLLGEEALLELLDSLRGNESRIGRYLFVVPDHQDLLAPQDGRKRPQVGLTRLIDDHQVERADLGRYRLGDPGMTHDPARHGAGGIEHRFPGIPPITGGIGARALTDSADGRRIAGERLQQLWRRVAFRREPRGLGDDTAVTAGEA